MTNPTPDAIPDRVSDEALQVIATRNEFSPFEQRMAAELIARRKSGSAVEAYDDVLGMLQDRLEECLINAEWCKGSLSELARYDEVRRAFENVEQRRRDAAGEKM